MKFLKKYSIWLLSAFVIPCAVLWWMALLRSWLPRTLLSKTTFASITYSPHAAILACVVEVDDVTTQVQLWDTNTRTLKWKDTLEPEHLMFSPDGHWLATLINTPKTQIVIWNVATGKRVKTLAPPYGNGTLELLGFSANSQNILVQTHENQIIRIDSTTGRTLAPLTIPHLWSFPTLHPLQKTPRQGAYRQAYLRPQISNRGDLLIAMQQQEAHTSPSNQTLPSELWLFDRQGQPRFQFKNLDAANSSGGNGRFSNDGHWLLQPIAKEEKPGERLLQVWDIEKQRLARTLHIPGEGYMNWPRSMAVSRDGHVFVAYDVDTTATPKLPSWRVGIWNAPTGKLERTLFLPDLDHIMGEDPFLTLSGDEATLAVTGGFRPAPLQLWRLK